MINISISLTFSKSVLQLHMSLTDLIKPNYAIGSLRTARGLCMSRENKHTTSISFLVKIATDGKKFGLLGQINNIHSLNLLLCYNNCHYRLHQNNFFKSLLNEEIKAAHNPHCRAFVA